MLSLLITLLVGLIWGVHGLLVWAAILTSILIALQLFSTKTALRVARMGTGLIVFVSLTAMLYVIVANWLLLVLMLGCFAAVFLSIVSHPKPQPQADPYASQRTWIKGLRFHQA